MPTCKFLWKTLTDSRLITCDVTNNLTIRLIVDPTPLTPEKPTKNPVNNAALRGCKATTLRSKESSQHDKFEVEIGFREPITPPASSKHKRQKNSHNYIHRESDSPTPALTKNYHVNSTVNEFVVFLEDVFEAEDAFDPDAEVPTEASLTFFSQHSFKEPKPCS